MKTIQIDDATHEQLDYAVAAAQWDYHKGFFKEHYHPTTNQAQCGELIEKYCINLHWEKRICVAWTGINHPENRTLVSNKSHCVAVCKAVLWLIYPDGLIPIPD